MLTELENPDLPIAIISVRDSFLNAILSRLLTHVNLISPHLR